MMLTDMQPNPDLRTWLAMGPLHRPGYVHAAVLRRVEEMLKELPPCWRVLELPGRDGVLIPAVRCTFGKVVVDSEMIPFQDPSVVKLAVLHSDNCPFVYHVKDRASSRDAVSCGEAISYHAPDLIEQLAAFLCGSILVVEVTGTRVETVSQACDQHGGIGSFELVSSEKELYAVRKAAKKSAKLLRRLRPKLREIQGRLIEDLRALN
jgi:hypothetical protein